MSIVQTFRSILTSNNWSSFSAWLLKTSPWLNSWLGRSRKAESLFSDNWTSVPWLEWNRWCNCWLELLSIWAESWFSLSPSDIFVCVYWQLDTHSQLTPEGKENVPRASFSTARWRLNQPWFEFWNELVIIPQLVIQKVTIIKHCAHSNFKLLFSFKKQECLWIFSYGGFFKKRIGQVNNGKMWSNKEEVLLLANKKTSRKFNF